MSTRYSVLPRHHACSFASVLAVLALSLFSVQRLAAADPDPARFLSPGREDRPGSWMFWLGGNVSPSGIDDSLAALKATGLGSVVMMQVSAFGGPEGPVKVLSREWQELYQHYLREAKRREIDVVLFTSPVGWSMMGDATVKPAESSKRLTSVEVAVEGGGPREIKLPQPPAQLNVYEDLAVVAFPEPAGNVLPAPSVQGGPPGFNWAPLLDDDWRTGVVLPDADTTLELIYPQPVTVRTLRFWMGTWRRRPSSVRVEAESAPGHWRRLGEMDTYWPHGPQDVPLTIRLEAATAAHFRVTFAGGKGAEANGLELSGAARVDLFSPKAGYTQRKEHGGGADLLRASAERWAVADRAPGIVPGSLLNLSGRLQPDGTLKWEAPPGRWRVLRIGWTTQGHRTSPSPPGVRNYIIDPTAAGAVERYWSGFPSSILREHGPARQGAVRAVELDSWEAGNLNWSPGLAGEFARRRGYLLEPYWPVLAAGHLVGNALESERFLRDFRLTLAELISAHYYGETARMAERDGVACWAEAVGRQQFLYHPTEYARHAQVPMGEFWVNEDVVRPDCRAAASVAAFYGRPLVAGESFTSIDDRANFDFTPADYKRLGDEALVEGINHFHLHMNALSPYRGPGPGMNASWIGQQFHAGNTWWRGRARGWTDYLARCQYLLRAGRNVADLLYFAGEDFPAELPARDAISPAIPAGWEYDVCGPTELLRHLRVEPDGTLVSVGGARYRLLLVRRWPTMSVEIAQRLEELVDAGATLMGDPPQLAPSLTNVAEAERTIRRISRKLWGAGAAGGPDGSAVRSVGRGRVLGLQPLEQAYRALGHELDFVVPPGNRLRFRHRTGDGFDTYFVSNQDSRSFAQEVGFRVAGRQPELWDPLTGRVGEVTHWRETDGLTWLPLDLPAHGSMFVVFRRATRAPSGARVTAPAAPPVALLTLPGPWRVTFPPGLGAPTEIVLPRLASLHEHGDSGVKHFSGTATYATGFELPPPVAAPGDAILLDLGAVHGIAEVTLNGRPLANLWCPPYRVELPGGALRLGRNELAVAVTGTWRNRMIGDEQLPRDFAVVERRAGDERAGVELIRAWPDWYVRGEPRPEQRRISFSTTLYYRVGDPLRPSGLIGPVMLRRRPAAD